MRAIRIWLLVFVIGLVISGVTAFPLVAETRLVAAALHAVPAPSALVGWVDRVHEGLRQTGKTYPFIAYGTDWLAFAHLVIALAFWGPWRDPVRNVWVVEWGMLCCAAVVPLALIAGPIRQLPWGWEALDMSFGIVGIVPLVIVRLLIKKLPAEAPGGRPQSTPRFAPARPCPTVGPWTSGMRRRHGGATRTADGRDRSVRTTGATGS